MADKGSSEKPKWPLEGHFACAGGGLFVEIDCLGRTFQSQTESHSLTITLPRLDSRAPEAPLARPPWKFVGAGSEQDSAVAVDAKWGTIGSMTERGAKFPDYAEVHQCIVHSEIEATDKWEFLNGAKALACDLDVWWRAFTDWLGALTNQDFVQLGSKQLSVREHGFCAWSGDEAGQRHTSTGSNLFVVPGRPDVLSVEHLQTCMKLARKCDEPPIEWLLIRDARSLSKAHEYRRAVLDAGTAAELALVALLEDHLYPAGDDVRRALFDRYKTLGGLKDLASKLIPQKVPERLTDELIKPRNAAVHKAKDPVSKETAIKAINKAAELVAILHPIGS